MTKCSNIYQY